MTPGGDFTAVRRAGWWRADAPPSAAAVASDAAPGGRLPFAALLAFTFVLLLAPQAWFPALAPLRLALLAAALAVGTYLLAGFTRRLPLVRWSRETAFAAALFAWAVATVPFSVWPGGSVEVLFDTYLKALIVFWLLGSLVSTVPRLETTLWALSLMAAPLALTAVHNFVAGAFIPEGGGRILGYDAPLTRNPNDLALMLNLILPLTAALLPGARSMAARGLLVALILLDVAAVVVTFSRAGFLTLAIIATVYLLTLAPRSKLKFGAAAFALAIAGLALLPASYLGRLGTITDIEADASGSARTRWTDMRAAAGYAVSHPIVGTGVGMHILVMNDLRGETWTKVHNVYLEHAMDLGLPGLALFVLLLRECLRTARRARAAAGEGGYAPRLRFLAGGIHVSLIAFAAAAFFHPVAYHFYFYYIAGLAVGAGAAADALERRGLTTTSVNETARA